MSENKHTHQGRVDGTILGVNYESGPMAEVWIPCNHLFFGLEPRNRAGTVVLWQKDQTLRLWGYLDCVIKKSSSLPWPD